MFRMSTIACLVTLVTVAASPPLPAAEAREPRSALFSTLHGRDVRQAQATISKGDDAALAAKLLTIARNDKPDDDYLRDLCDYAFELGKTSEQGRTSAIDAMRLLASKHPELLMTAAERLLPLFQEMYDGATGSEKKELGRQLIEAAVAIGDHKLNVEAAPGTDLVSIFGAVMSAQKHFELAATIARAEGIDVPMVVTEGKATADLRYDAIQKVRTERQLLRSGSINASLAQSIRVKMLPVLLVELDDPNLVIAENCVGGARSAEERKNIMMAAGAPAPASADDFAQMGEWYLRLWREAPSDPTKAAMSARSAYYYDKFLAMYKTLDAKRAAAQRDAAIVRGQEPPAEALALLNKKEPVVPSVTPKPAPTAVDPKPTVKPTPKPTVKPAPIKPAPTKPDDDRSDFKIVRTAPKTTPEPDKPVKEATADAGDSGYSRKKFLLPVGDDPERKRGFFGLSTD